MENINSYSACVEDDTSKRVRFVFPNFLHISLTQSSLPKLFLMCGVKEELMDNIKLYLLPWPGAVSLSWQTWLTVLGDSAN